MENVALGLALAGGVAFFVYLARTGELVHRVRLFTRLLGDAKCENCDEVFTHAAAAAAIHEEDTAMDGRQENSTLAAASLGAPMAAHVTSSYPIICSNCGRRSIFRVADHAVLLQPSDNALEGPSDQP